MNWQWQVADREFERIQTLHDMWSGVRFRPYDYGGPVVQANRRLNGELAGRLFSAHERCWDMHRTEELLGYSHTARVYLRVCEELRDLLNWEDLFTETLCRCLRS